MYVPDPAAVLRTQTGVLRSGGVIAPIADDPHCEPVMIDRDHVGEHCQITWDRWLRIGNDTEIENAADMIASVLNTCARFGAKQTPVVGVGAEA